MSDLDTLQEAIERSDKSLAEWTAIRRKHTQRALFRDVDAKAVADAVVDKRPEPAENELE